MPETITHLVITGGQGYIGRHLARRAAERGLTVTLLVRRPADARIFGLDTVRVAAWELGSPLPVLDLPWKQTGVLHLAHDWSDREPRGINFRGTQKLWQSAQELEAARFIFVSSQSARRDAANAYGRIKWAVEQLFQGSSVALIRVGLVYGGPQEGLFGLMLKLVQSTPILPIVSARKPVQPIHIDEVADGLLAYIGLKINGVQGLATPQSVPFGQFLKCLAREYYARRILILPIPLSFALFACDLLSLVPFLPKNLRERVLGLSGIQKMNCRHAMRSIGIDVEEPAFHIRRSAAGRKLLLREGWVLMSYVLGRAPPLPSLRRYAHATAALYRDDGPLPLSRLLVAMPRLLRLAEPRDNGGLAVRLRIAASLLETTAFGVSIFYPKRFKKLRLLVALGMDAVCAPVRMAFQRK